MRYKLFILLLCNLAISNSLFSSNATTADVFVALPFTIEHESLKQDLVTLQENIHKKADEDGYKISLMPKEKLHITLYAAKALSKQTAKQCKDQAKKIAQTTAPFNISTELHGSRLELLGQEKNWIVLRLYSSEKKPLVQLAQRLRWNFHEQIGSDQSEDEPFKAHVTLGRFKKNKKPSDASWLDTFKSQHASLMHAKDSCFMRSILFSTGTKTKKQTNQKTQTRTIKNTLQLQTQAAANKH